MNERTRDIREIGTNWRKTCTRGELNWHSSHRQVKITGAEGDLNNGHGKWAITGMVATTKVSRRSTQAMTGCIHSNGIVVPFNMRKESNKERPYRSRVFICTIQRNTPILSINPFWTLFGCPFTQSYFTEQQNKQNAQWPANQPHPINQPVFVRPSVSLSGRMLSPQCTSTKTFDFYSKQQGREQQTSING